ncbi:MAG: endo-1,4-beta-xylanase [Pontiellaceae bacterium]|nr:endo-1,4-beta-xylanase [Pontiellaceae bacterium]MBN2785590.1 endo-1,4-beta-xylanase [Pontiellaceae bacterium]
MRVLQIVLSLVVTTLFSGCVSIDEESLASEYRDDFLIGTALGSEGGARRGTMPMRRDMRELEVVEKEFNCVTAENLMKWRYLQPQPGQFDFVQADEFMEYAEERGLTVVGHTLVWHSQAPRWLFHDENGESVSREVLIERMRDHIHTVVGRYKGRIKYWDVVNEAVDTRMVEDDSLPPDEGGNPQKKRIAFYRESPWLKIIGPEYIEMAFRFAHEADPDAILLYNDFSMTDIEKTEFVAQMIRHLKAEGVPVHEVGMQGHWHLEYPTREELQDAIDVLVGCGVSVSVTELDVGVLPREEGHRGANISDQTAYRAEMNPYTEGLPVEVEREQLDKYRMIFEVLLANSQQIERVTFWGVSDRYSWKNGFPVRGRTDYPLLFDRQMKPKPVVDMLRNLPGRID